MPEPYLFPPCLLILAWLFVLLRPWLKLGTAILLVIAALRTAVMVSLLCAVWVWLQARNEEELGDSPRLHHLTPS